ncbi:signal recognition particle, SRP9/SRP14 subunit [Cristinia sonorae]|uniref:Signal recognition particle, SRP9/SRP14 subunit n=1 Tax=Cristinia sonorae TaxID=1940300 RepID=A0A8K0UD60_9AGAR|nr:signal recognition particle, SRP9/SRP14 subunit [Cristinia sonorae]
MVYISSWQEYQEAAEALYERSPTRARYVVKWRASEGKLVLKITDDTTCLKFKTHSSVFLNRFEALNLSLMQKMQNRRPASPAIPSGNVETATKETPSAIAPVSTPGGGVKKKKKPKKK